jgi:hypothetical protein
MVMTTYAVAALQRACQRAYRGMTGGCISATTPQTLVSSNANPVPAAASTTPATNKFEGEIVVEVKNGAGRRCPRR